MRSVECKCKRCGGTGIEYRRDQMGKRLQEKRYKSGKTQEQVAKAMGFDVGYIGLIETGRRRITGKFVADYLKALRKK